LALAAVGATGVGVPPHTNQLSMNVPLVFGQLGVVEKEAGLTQLFG